MADLTYRDKQRSTDFSSYYQSLCTLQSTYPVASIKNCTQEGILNCQTYKLKRLDWYPLLTALRANRALHTVVFREKWEERAQHYLNDETVRARLPLRLVTMTTDNQTINEIIRSLKPFLSQNCHITSLLLEGLNIDLKHIKLLSKGLEKNQSLKLLSLKGSGTGDKGVQILCQVLKYSYCIEWLDLTWCNLTTNSTTYLSELIRYHSLHRQSSLWKNSLRGGHFPSTQSSTGLRRLTLNLNPNLRDSGASTLASVLEDDVWIKALDMQTCGLTTSSAVLFQTLLQTSNSGLEVLDLRENRLMDDEEVDLVIEILTNKVTSGHHRETSYKWLDVELLRIQSELKLTGIPIHHKRTVNSKKTLSTSTTNWARKKGLPWRTATRSTQRWRNTLPKSVSITHHSKTISSSSISSASTNEVQCTTAGINISNSTSLTSEGCPVQVTLTLEQFKQIQTEIKLCHLKLRDYEETKLRMKTKLKQLEEENQLLKEVKIKEDQSTSSLDESTIRNIESAFEQFHSFLDLLNKKGYGHLSHQLLEKK